MRKQSMLCGAVAVSTLIGLPPEGARAGLVSNMSGGAATLPVGGPAQPPARDFVNATVFADMWVFSRSFDFNINGPASAASPGSTVMAENSGTGLVEDVRVTVTVETLSTNERRVDVVFESVSGRPIVEPGTLLGGEAISAISFAFGMYTFGAFPGLPVDPFQDPHFRGVVSASGSLTNSFGSTVFDGGLFVADFDDGWGGRLFFFATDENGEFDPGRDITFRRAQRLTTSVVYTIPGPGGIGVMCYAGAWALRRRRCTRFIPDRA